MRHFDYETAAREARIPSDKLDELRRLVRSEFPQDDMMYELHLLRVCMAVREGAVTLEDALRPAPTTST
ncbi:MAG: hypothetical protein DMG22_22560 [Acidobacteria bacterium]|nr:MAG: hypothetical protein DMG22_22560 [Acidobacteriota bacterium]